MALIFPSRLGAALPSQSVSSCYHDKHHMLRVTKNKVLHTEPQAVPLEDLRLNPQNEPSKRCSGTTAGARGKDSESLTPARLIRLSTTSEQLYFQEFWPFGFIKSCLEPVNLLGVFLTTVLACQDCQGLKQQNMFCWAPSLDDHVTLRSVKPCGDEAAWGRLGSQRLTRMNDGLLAPALTSLRLHHITTTFEHWGDTHLGQCQTHTHTHTLQTLVTFS